MRRRTKLRKLAIPLLVGGVALTVAEAARRIFRQNRLFLPSRHPVKSWDPADYGIARDAVEEQWFETPDGELLHGWYCRAKKPIASGLFCHGNTGNITVTADVIPHLLDAGFNVLFFDYRGFGKSSGVPTITGVVSDGVTAARFHDTLRPKNLPSILYGFSLGGAVAAQVIKRHPFDALILHSTFTSLPEITRVAFPRLPLHRFAGNFFDTLSVIRRLTVPLLVVHGSNDEVIPAWMAHQLYDACGVEKQIEIVNGGMHKDLYDRDCDSLVWAINRFASELPPGARAVPIERETATDRVIDLFFRFVRRMTRRRKLAPISL